MTGTIEQAAASRAEVFRQISAFESAYDYDAGYMRDLFDRSTVASQLFNALRPMASYYQKLPAEVHFTAAITVMQQEDCSGCLELNLKLAREAEVSEDILSSLSHSPETLPPILQDVRKYTRDCLRTGPVDEAVARRIEEHYGKEAFAELATCIVGVRMYPGIKRALLLMQTCTAP